MRKYLIKISLIVTLLITLFGINIYAKDLDYIDRYVVTVNPRVDGTLDIRYDFEWTVLDSTIQGPLTWIKVGTANRNFNELKALSNNIKKIEKYNGSYVAIYFDRAYSQGQSFKFSFSLHQSNIYSLNGTNCNYSFTPGWFNDCLIGEMVIRWNNNSVKNTNANNLNDSNYLMWYKQNLSYGEKLTAEIEYSKTAFKNLKQTSFNAEEAVAFLWIILIIIIVIIRCILSPTSYSNHSGFYNDRYDRYYDSYNSCACASSCACACACAGGGRAGCSKKDLYGVKIKKGVM